MAKKSLYGCGSDLQNSYWQTPMENHYLSALRIAMYFDWIKMNRLFLETNPSDISVLFEYLSKVSLLWITSHIFASVAATDNVKTKLSK